MDHQFVVKPQIHTRFWWK